MSCTHKPTLVPFRLHCSLLNFQIPQFSSKCHLGLSTQHEPKYGFIKKGFQQFTEMLNNIVNVKIFITSIKGVIIYIVNTFFSSIENKLFILFSTFLYK